MPKPRSYIRNGAEIYAQSFAIIRAEADLTGLSGHAEKIAVRMIHACGMPEIAREIAMSETFVSAARTALMNGAPILCDSKMVANGITVGRLPARNAVICTLDREEVPALAAESNNTRSAAALEMWRPHLAGALVAIGNAPTALFRLLEMLDEGASHPAAISTSAGRLAFTRRLVLAIAHLSNAEMRVARASTNPSSSGSGSARFTYP